MKLFCATIQSLFYISLTGSKVSDSGAPRPFTVNSWVEDSPSKPTGMKHDLNESKR